jgi:hypothetical protein
MRAETRRGRGERGDGVETTNHSPSVVCKAPVSSISAIPVALSQPSVSLHWLVCHHGCSDHAVLLTNSSSYHSTQPAHPQYLIGVPRLSPRVVGGGDAHAHLMSASSQLSNTKSLEHTSCLKYHVASAMPENVEKYNFICYAQGSNSLEGLMKERNPWYSPDMSYHITSSFHRLTRWNQHCTTLSCLPEEKSSAASTVSKLKVRISRKYCNTTHKSP